MGDQKPLPEIPELEKMPRMYPKPPEYEPGVLPPTTPPTPEQQIYLNGFSVLTQQNQWQGEQILFLRKLAILLLDEARVGRLLAERVAAIENKPNQLMWKAVKYVGTLVLGILVALFYQHFHLTAVTP